MEISLYKSPLTLLTILSLLFDLGNALYGSSSPVLQLTPSNFKSKVRRQTGFYLKISSSCLRELRAFSIDSACVVTNNISIQNSLPMIDDLVDFTLVVKWMTGSEFKWCRFGRVLCAMVWSL